MFLELDWCIVGLDLIVLFKVLLLLVFVLVLEVGVLELLDFFFYWISLDCVGCGWFEFIERFWRSDVIFEVLVCLLFGGGGCCCILIKVFWVFVIWRWSRSIWCLIELILFNSCFNCCRCIIGFLFLFCWMICWVVMRDCKSCVFCSSCWSSISIGGGSWWWRSWGFIRLVFTVRWSCCKICCCVICCWWIGIGLCLFIICLGGGGFGGGGVFMEFWCLNFFWISFCCGGIILELFMLLWLDCGRLGFFILLNWFGNCDWVFGKGVFCCMELIGIYGLFFEWVFDMLFVVLIFILGILGFIFLYWKIFSLFGLKLGFFILCRFFINKV